MTKQQDIQIEIIIMSFVFTIAPCTRKTARSSFYYHELQTLLAIETSCIVELDFNLGACFAMLSTSCDNTEVWELWEWYVSR